MHRCVCVCLYVCVWVRVCVCVCVWAYACLRDCSLTSGLKPVPGGQGGGAGAAAVGPDQGPATLTVKLVIGASQLQSQIRRMRKRKKRLFFLANFLCITVCIAQFPVPHWQNNYYFVYFVPRLIYILWSMFQMHFSFVCVHVVQVDWWLKGQRVKT